MSEQPISMYNERAGILELQSYLRILALFDDAIPAPPLSGIYDRQTRLSVSAFQKIQHIDPAAPDAPYETFCRARDLSAAYLRAAAAGDGFFALSDPGALERLSEYPQLVAQIQLALAVVRQIVPQIKAPQINGKFDDALAPQIRLIQKVSRLPQTGIMDRESYNALVGLYNTAMRRLQSGEPPEKSAFLF